MGLGADWRRAFTGAVGVGLVCACAPALAQALTGASAGAVEAHAAVGQLEQLGEPMCTAALVGPGWALTAAHCLDDSPRSLRMLSGYRGALSLGKAHRSPDGGDIALVEVPDAHALGIQGLPLPPALADCPARTRPVQILSAAHGNTGLLLRSPVSAAINVFDECDAHRHLPILVATDEVRAGICMGDSGAPVLGSAAGQAVVVGVVVANVTDRADGRCGRDHSAIGYMEPTTSARRLAWLARATSPPALRATFPARLVSAQGGRIRIHTGPWQAAPPPGTTVALVRGDGATVRRTTVHPSGAVVVRRPAPGTYRLRARTAGGHARWSVPLRVAPG